MVVPASVATNSLLMKAPIGCSYCTPFGSVNWMLVGAIAGFVWARGAGRARAFYIFPALSLFGLSLSPWLGVWLSPGRNRVPNPVSFAW